MTVRRLSLRILLLLIAVLAGSPLVLGSDTHEYPPIGEASRQAAERIVKIMDDAGIGKKDGRAIGVAISADGKTVVVAVSGYSGKTQELYEKLRPKLPEGWKLAPTSVDTSWLEDVRRPNGSVNRSETCAEPKLWDAVRSLGVSVKEMAVRWRGNKKNPYPLPGDPQYMEPCESCAHNEERIVHGPPDFGRRKPKGPDEGPSQPPDAEPSRPPDGGLSSPPDAGPKNEGGSATDSGEQGTGGKSGGDPTRPPEGAGAGEVTPSKPPEVSEIRPGEGGPVGRTSGTRPKALEEAHGGKIGLGFESQWRLANLDSERLRD